MSFIPISLDEYLKIHLKSNSNEEKKSFRSRLETALDAFNAGFFYDDGYEITHDQIKELTCTPEINSPYHKFL